MREVFISYKSNDPKLGNNDGNVANELCAAIEAAGISCWIAPRDIEPGVRYGRAILEAISSCKVMVVVFSKHADISEHIANEVDAIFARNIDIIPFNIDGTNPGLEFEYYLRRMQWIDASGDYRKKIPELIKALRHKLGITINPVNQGNQVDKALVPAEPPIKTFNVKGVSLRMIRVESGTFMMGATPEQGDDVASNEKPAHQETVSTFYIGETPVTNLLWTTVMGSDSDSKSFNVESISHPVMYKSWNKCQKFIAKLNELTGKQFRLPTEAEWEYAARGGKLSKSYKYSGSNNLDEVAWYDKNSDFKVHAVATKKPNELGLYDMSGSVGEWCQDKAENYDMFGFRFHHRIVRGANAYLPLAWCCRVSYRGSYEDISGNGGPGLRLALSD